jgi:hypothetical protein
VITRCYVPNSFIVKHVCTICYVQDMLAFSTSAADMGKRLLLSEVNYWYTFGAEVPWLHRNMRGTGCHTEGGGRCVVSMISENKKG